MTAEGLKQLKMWVIGLASVIGAGTAVYEFHIKTMENIKKFVHEESAPIAKEEAEKAIKATVDSIYSTTSKTIHVGLRYDPETGKVIYIHTNGKEYRAFLDMSNLDYYFINDNNESEWCK
jgi:hypothetical protein